MSQYSRSPPRYMWPHDHQRVDYTGDRIRREAEEIKAKHIAAGAPSDLHGYLEWLELHQVDFAHQP